MRRPRNNPRIRLSTAAVRCRRTFTYHADGQLATATVGGEHRAPRDRVGPPGGRPLPEPETFLWDGLALIQRDDEQFMNEPHVGGGNPVASSKGTSYFNDALGTTVGAKKDGKYSAAALTAFGENHLTTEPPNHQTFFTGKPYVEGLGHAFLMRNYRAGLAKWQSADPMGYPDGWNQLAYCGNGVARKVDIVGCWGANVHHDINQTYLENQEIDRHAYKWGKFSLDVLGKMNSGSDWTDSIWAGNQNDDKAYMHAMCSAWEGTAGARLRWETYLNELVVKARALSDLARQMYSTGDYEIALYTENLAIEYLGRIFHTYDDSFAPPHSGFQRFSDQNLFDHIAQESWDVFVTGEYRVELPHVNPIPGNEAVTIITYRTGGFRNYIYQQIRDAYMQTVLYVLRQPE